ncbi:uncharacterized protein LOC34617952 [Cyclospora cayetanensis]|uniref:tRNA-intron lyase n=1 Tax=Cyclospora cayetanensis TaxID=88456 RepID=A0A6P6S345_9EIME|nr:uncharacterized protein LOC34617952 [Cyclospora cayetanensis]
MEESAASSPKHRLEPESPWCSGISSKSLAWRQQARTKVLEDLTRKGFLMKEGASFGADFLGYAADPRDAHASFLVSTNVGPSFSLISMQRIANSTKKAAIVALVTCSTNPPVYIQLDRVKASPIKSKATEKYCSSEANEVPYEPVSSVGQEQDAYDATKDFLLSRHRTARVERVGMSDSADDCLTACYPNTAKANLHLSDNSHFVVRAPFFRNMNIDLMYCAPISGPRCKSARKQLSLFELLCEASSFMLHLSAYMSLQGALCTAHVYERSFAMQHEASA